MDRGDFQNPRLELVGVSPVLLGGQIGRLRQAVGKVAMNQAVKARLAGLNLLDVGNGGGAGADDQITPSDLHRFCQKVDVGHIVQLHEVSRHRLTDLRSRSAGDRRGGGALWHQIVDGTADNLRSERWSGRCLDHHGLSSDATDYADVGEFGSSGAPPPATAMAPIVK